MKLITCLGPLPINMLIYLTHVQHFTDKGHNFFNQGFTVLTGHPKTSMSEYTTTFLIKNICSEQKGILL